MRNVWITACLLALVIGGTAAIGADVPSRPDIVILYADDLGYGDVGCYNPDRGKIATPAIDALAKQGMRFTDAHSSSGVCSPSRYTLLTGRYHWRTRLQKGIVGLWGPPVIPPERLTVASLAHQQGYRTACIGKWHLGWNWPISESQRPYFNSRAYRGKKDLKATPEHRKAWRDVFTQAIPGGPTAVGFDHYFGTDVPNWPPYCFIDDDHTLGIPSEFADPRLFARNQASQQGPALPDWKLEPILPTIGQHAVQWIREAAQHDEPFLLYVPLTSPHTPLAVEKKWVGASGLGLYADFVMQTDAVIGDIVRAIDQTDRADNTLVVFTSDNGCAPYIGVDALEAQGHYPSGPLRGYKSDVWEGGHRVPLIVRWPSVVATEQTDNHLVHQADLMATIADILEFELPEDAGEDSFSMLGLLNQQADSSRDVTHPRTISVSCSIRGIPSLRIGSWKYIADSGSGGWSKGGDPGQPVQLYRLTDDIGETHNLAASQPQRVKDMQAELERIITLGRSTPGARQPNDVKVVRWPKR